MVEVTTPPITVKAVAEVMVTLEVDFGAQLMSTLEALARVAVVVVFMVGVMNGCE